VLRLAVRAVKDVTGFVLIVAGLLMLVLPGQGLLCVLLGVILIDFPGKRAAELRLMRIGGVHRTIDVIRAKFGRPPLRLPPRPPDSPEDDTVPSQDKR
jgi:hypothetical protein